MFGHVAQTAWNILGRSTSLGRTLDMVSISRRVTFLVSKWLGVPFPLSGPWFLMVQPAKMKRTCHSMVHRTFSHSELGRHYNSIEAPPLPST